ncbi:MAG TPA: hypothetical protein V6D23_00420, partial [Candidatus Obscuribacterales bacterium]
MMIKQILTAAAEQIQTNAGIPPATADASAGLEEVQADSEPEQAEQENLSAAVLAEPAAEDAYASSLPAGAAQSAISLEAPAEPRRTDLFPEEPSAGQVTRSATRQANPDLSLAAAMVSLAQTRPEQLTGLIKDKQGDRWTVQFPGYDKPLTVVCPGRVESGTWVKVLEDAYRQTHADGSVPADPIYLLTGKYVDMTWLNRLTPENTREKLVDSLSRDKVVSAYDRSQHETYAVTRYNPDTDSVSLRAALGNESLTLSLEHFRERFATI